MTERERTPEHEDRTQEPDPAQEGATSEGDPGPPEMEYFEKGRVVPETDRR